MFDLDDTLYDEMQFVKGGFKKVSLYVSRKYNVDKNFFYNLLLEILEKHGRGSTFNIALKKIGLDDNKITVDRLINIYHTHMPDILLYPQVKKTLNALKKKGYKLGLITDGNVYVQQSKVRALKISAYFDCEIFSDEYGTNKRKPSLFPYEKMLKELNVHAEETVYVGDNPHKDFIGAKKIGMSTVRILKGNYKDIRLVEKYEAKYVINELKDLTELILKTNM